MRLTAVDEPSPWTRYAGARLAELLSEKKVKTEPKKEKAQTEPEKEKAKAEPEKEEVETKSKKEEQDG